MIKPVRTRQSKSWGPRIGIALVLLAGSPVLVDLLSVDFVPSEAWVLSVFWPACVVGVLAGAGALWAVHRSLNDGIQNSDPIKTVFAVLLAPIFGFYSGYLAVTASIPMLTAIASFKVSEIEFTVEDANVTDKRRCPRPISLEGIPYGVEVVCGVPGSVRSHLTSGNKVFLIGYGSSLGIFPYQARLP